MCRAVAVTFRDSLCDTFNVSNEYKISGSPRDWHHSPGAQSSQSLKAWDRLLKLTENWPQSFGGYHVSSAWSGVIGVFIECSVQFSLNLVVIKLKMKSEVNFYSGNLRTKVTTEGTKLLCLLYFYVTGLHYESRDKSVTGCITTHVTGLHYKSRDKSLTRLHY